MTEPSPTIKAWSHLLTQPKLADFFRGMFEHLGVRVRETGEQFTVHHDGDQFSVTDGIDESRVDYVADLRQENVDNMVRHGADGQIDRSEAFAIVSVLFTPLTVASLKNPMMSNGFYRWLGRIENLIHVHLLDPDGGSANTHTLVHVNGEWIVVPGLHGTARRTFRIDIDQAVDYQKKVFQAMRQNSFGGWWKFGSWYRGWRQSVSA